MGLSGSLREFHLSEIIQLLSSQKKTGCLKLTQDGAAFVIYFEDGRIHSAREPGLSKTDPLMKFLRRVHWLSDEQLHGVESLHHDRALFVTIARVVMIARAMPGRFKLELVGDHAG